MDSMDNVDKSLMSMFDHLKCEVPLPLPEDLGELENVIWDNVEFQTKDLNNYLGYYVLAPDNELYEERLAKGDVMTFWDIDDPEVAKVLMPCHYHGVVVFYTYIQKSEHDYDITFRAVFTQGFLESLTLEEFKECDNTERLVKEAAYQLKAQRIQRIRASKKYVLYKYLYRKPIMWLGHKTRRFTQWLYSKSWKVERWLVRF